ncbi:MAG: hypothetical protein H0U52_02675 [Chloroflexi bacterium]|nr:hypothetical protein [Chloroflexota bacterium]
MAEQKTNEDRDFPTAVSEPGERGTAGAQGTAGQALSIGGTGGGTGDGEHHAAKAHGMPATVDTSLPGTRDELMTLHAAARARRNGAPLGGDAFRAAVDELARIEIRIAAIDRAADPPLG